MQNQKWIILNDSQSELVIDPMVVGALEQFRSFDKWSNLRDLEI